MRPNKVETAVQCSVCRIWVFAKFSHHGNSINIYQGQMVNVDNACTPCLTFLPWLIILYIIKSVIDNFHHLWILAFFVFLISFFRIVVKSDIIQRVEMGEREKTQLRTINLVASLLLLSREHERQNIRLGGWKRKYFCKVGVTVRIWQYWSMAVREGLTKKLSSQI